MVLLGSLTPLQHLARQLRCPEVSVCLSLLHCNGYRAGAQMVREGAQLGLGSPFPAAVANAGRCAPRSR